MGRNLVLNSGFNLGEPSDFGALQQTHTSLNPRLRQANMADVAARFRTSSKDLPSAGFHFKQATSSGGSVSKGTSKSILSSAGLYLAGYSNRHAVTYLQMTDDGTHIYLKFWRNYSQFTNQVTNTLACWRLPEPWNMASIDFSNNLNLIGTISMGGSDHGSVATNADGTKVILLNGSGLFTYEPENPYQVSNLVNTNAGAASLNGSPAQIGFSKAGRYFWASESGKFKVFELSTPYDVTSIDPDSPTSEYLSHSGSTYGSLRHGVMSENGELLIQHNDGFNGNFLDDIIHWRLTTPYDVTTRVFVNNWQFSGGNESFCLKKDGTAIFLVNGRPNTSNDANLYTKIMPTAGY